MKSEEKLLKEMGISSWNLKKNFSFDGKHISKKDIKNIDKKFDVLTGKALMSTVGKFYQGTRYGVSVDPSSRHYARWVNSRKNYFKPYEINSIYIRSNKSTWLLINDHIEGFDLKSDAIIQLVGFQPSRTNQITII